MNPATGMPDYSAQWAEYYRSIGYIQEAEKIEQQVTVKTSECFFVLWKIL
jgi:Domain of unknown function (DUF1897)